ncbi:cation-translocating P-type ATPase [Anaerococcus sp.]|uniref:cation-translocating P-type ATPase n=1 Tax=Anaerococcus TaxID=165779 RepID=UPI0028FF5600|nr:cation-translocating P-type ATPase [Anaerococcus sp.]MDU1828729.1 cation-translocating P-type ATPase [Anaerococcus sp.]MDU1865300.1 cation-translocating P-type ATPase [Anaerococcus sp.]MDU2566656.1 cation-translocating P-type ATPase [Anaerococcus sp.]
MDYQGSKKEILEKIGSDPKKGLSSNEASSRLEKYGPNKIESSNKKSLGKKILEQILDPMVILLILASIVSMFTGDKIEAIIIIAIVVINAIMSIYQEGQAEDSVAALQKMSSPEATVIRDGKRGKVKAEDLVPGDIVVLETGDIIPADIRLLDSRNLQIDESSLTGESVSVEKDAEELYDKEVGIGDRKNFAYSSSIVTYGHGEGLITSTGHNTEIGRIATSLDTVEDKQTPLQRQLKDLSKKLAILVVIICALVFVVGYFRTSMSILDNFMVAVSLAVAAIPEGLTAVVTIVLSIGMNRMVDKKAIVKNLVSVETLGSTTAICSDKTGTLTQNEMTITKVYTDFKEYDVEGSGYTPKGDISHKGDVIDDDSQIKLIMTIASLSNDANLIEKNGSYEITGDPTEAAMLTLSEKWDIVQEDLNEAHPRIDEIPFDSDRKMMTTFHNIDKNYYAMTKGAPDVMINNSSKIMIDGKLEDFTDDLKEKVLKENTKLAKQALRVMAYAFKPYESLENEELSTENIEREMVFVGLTGMIDPPRPEAKAAVEECHNSGIDVFMITGDYFETALAIAKELGIAECEDQAMQGSDLNNKSEEEIREIVKTKRIFARVSPQNKVQLVNALQANGEVVAMTGDGVNDAPAIKNADIGISMGITGTDVAKDTADMILVDDNFATIVNAVEEGRVIFSNIKKFVSFLLSCNIAEVAIVFLSILFGLPSPLTPIQLLWLNLVTDAFPALALGVEPAEADIMERKPRDPDAAITSGETGKGIIFQSIAITISVLLAYVIGLKYIFPNNIEGAHTMVFATLITSELLRAFSVRSEKYTLKELGWFSNKNLVKANLLSFALLLVVMYVPILRKLFELEFISWQWWIILLLSFLPLLIGEIRKRIRK